MKQYMMAFAAMLLFTSVHAQVAWIDTAHHVTITGYAGILAGPKVSIETAKPTGSASLRAGGTMLFAPKKWFSFYGLAALELDETATVTPFYLMGITLRPSKIIAITVGKIPTPMTELRPVPTTLAAQFEPWTKTHILGSAYGGKVTIAPSRNFSLVAGSFWRGTDATVELGLGVPHFNIAGYYAIRSRSFGGAFILSFKPFSQTVSYSYNQTVGSLTCINIPRTNGLSLYSDVGFNSKDWIFVRGEWGVLKTFSVQVTKGLSVNLLTGVGYSQEIKSVKGYVMVTL